MFLILAVLNLVVIAKLVIGEIQPAQVRALRKPRQFIDVQYTEEKLPIRDHRLRQWVNRLKWRSRYEVKSLALGPEIDDRDLRAVGRDLPNLIELTLLDGRFTKDGLKSLTQLKRLRRLAFEDSNVDDDMVEALIGCESVTVLGLRGTFVTDAVGPTLFRFPKLHSVAVRYTAITVDAARSSASVSRAGIGNLRVSYEWNHNKPMLFGFRFRWADGRQSHSSVQPKNVDRSNAENTHPQRERGRSRKRRHVVLSPSLARRVRVRMPHL